MALCNIHREREACRRILALECSIRSFLLMFKTSNRVCIFLTLACSGFERIIPLFFSFYWSDFFFFLGVLCIGRRGLRLFGSGGCT